MASPRRAAACLWLSCAFCQFRIAYGFSIGNFCYFLPNTILKICAARKSIRKGKLFTLPCKIFRKFPKNLLRKIIERRTFFFFFCNMYPIHYFFLIGNFYAQTLAGNFPAHFFAKLAFQHIFFLPLNWCLRFPINTVMQCLHKVNIVL